MHAGAAPDMVFPVPLGPFRVEIVQPRISAPSQSSTPGDSVTPGRQARSRSVARVALGHSTWVTLRLLG